MPSPLPPAPVYGDWSEAQNKGAWYWAVQRAGKCRLVKAENVEQAAQRAFGGEKVETVIRLSPRRSLAQLKLSRLVRLSNARWEIEELD